MALNGKSEQKELVDALPDANIHLAFAWRDTPTDWLVRRVQMRDQLPEEFRRVALGATQDLHDNRIEIAYDPEWPLKSSEFFHLPNPRTASGPAAVGGDLFPQLDDFGQLSPYGRERRKSNPNLYVILAQLDDGSVAKFGRRVTARHLLDSTRWIRALWDQETFSLLRGPVVAFDPHTDWIEWRESLLILDTTGFHWTFRDVQQLAAAVQGHVDTITSKVTIINDNEFAERCRASLPMASKLQSVVEQKLYEKPISELKAYSAKYPELGIEWRDTALVFDGSLERQWSILKLFDEAGFTGDLSGEKFEAAAKRHL
jgi:hypothetical protein